MIGVVRGTVYTEFATIKEGLVLAESGKVTYVGEKVRFGSNYRKIDAKGKFVAPGLIDAHSHIGLIPEGLDWKSSDVNDFSGPIKPEMRVIDALDFFDMAFEDAIFGGVTTVYIGPGNTNVTGGVELITKTNKQVLIEETALKMTVTAKRSREYKSKQPYSSSKTGMVALLRNTLQYAKRWLKNSFELDESKYLQYSIISKVLRREMMVKIHLSTSPDEIDAFQRAIREFGICTTIDHVFGVDLVVEQIKSSNVSVAYGPTMISRVYSAFRYVNDSIPVELCEEGVLIVLMVDYVVIPQKHPTLLASVVVRNGLDREEALKVITINPARIPRIDDKIGSLTVGKSPDIVIFDELSLSPTPRVKVVLLMSR